MKLCSEVCVAKRHDFGCNFLGQGRTKVTPKIVPFSVSVLAVVTIKSRNRHMRSLLGWLETRLAQITLNYLNNGEVVLSVKVIKAMSR